MGDLVEPVATWSPSRSAREAFNYIDLSAIDQNSKLIVGARELPCNEAPSRARQLVARGDVLVSTVRPNLNGVARVPASLDGATASTGFCILRPHPDRLDGAFLFHWVKSPQFVAEMVKKATGASYPAVSDRIIFESPIPLPALSEQRRIAEVLNLAEALRAKRRAALAQLDTLTQSIFLDLVGDPATNPKSLPAVRLGDLTQIGTGSTPSRSNVANFGGTIPWVKTAEVNGHLITETEERISESAVRTARCRLYPVGSILVALYGQGKTRGRCAILGLIAATNQACGVLLPNARYDTVVLFAQLEMSYERLRAMGRGGNQENLNLGLLADFDVLLPALSLQQSFARRAAAIEKLRATQRTSLAELNALFSSLQHRAFRGEL